MAAGGLFEKAMNANGFAGVLPEHKFKIVEALQQGGYTVGMTGANVEQGLPWKRDGDTLRWQCKLTEPWHLR